MLSMNDCQGSHLARLCPHSPPCPGPSAPDRLAAHTIVSHPEQGWSLLCNGIVIFDDTGYLLPEGTAETPHWAAARSEFATEHVGV
jgi:hypothetical protein